MLNCLSDTWFQAPDHTKLPLLLAYHRLEVINNKVYTIGTIQTKHPRALGLATEVRKRFDLTSPLPVHPRQSLALDLACHRKWWTQMSFMLSQRCYVATVNI